MPTYRYRCSRCGEEFEVWQSIKDDALTVHDTCHGDLLKVMSPAGIVLKGSGFYKTDNRSGNGSRTGGGDGAKKDSAPKTEHTSASGGSGSGGSGSGSSGSGSGSSGSDGSSGSSSSSSSSSSTPAKDSGGGSSSGSTSSS